MKLLVPGNDIAYLFDFLTHTVQMKLGHQSTADYVSLLTFLTHTVQMKLSKNKQQTKKPIYKLLNPHGSDETLYLQIA